MIHFLKFTVTYQKKIMISKCKTSFSSRYHPTFLTNMDESHSVWLNLAYATVMYSFLNLCEREAELLTLAAASP